MPARWVIGLASGGSGEAIEAALVEVEGSGLDLRARLLHNCRQPFGADLRDLIRRVASPAPCEIRHATLLHRLLGESFAAAARAVADRASFSLQRVLSIGCPNHVVWHEAEGRFPTTLGLGMASVVAERCGVTTIGDFSDRDISAGGQGAPLTALADYLLFRHPVENRVLLHLGSVAQVLFLPAGCRLPAVTGFDVGPCNGLLNGLMRQLTGGRDNFDPGGKYAVQGKCTESLLDSWLKHPFLHRRPPKSLPRHIFGDSFVAQAVAQAREHDGSLHDLLCTATHFVARCISMALERWRPSGLRIDRILISGGGVRNGLLRRLLEKDLATLPIIPTDDVGVPAATRRALAMAILAALTLDGVPGNLPSATGAAGSRLLGSLTPGSSVNWTRCLAWMAALAGPPLPGRD